MRRYGMDTIIVGGCLPETQNATISDKLAFVPDPSELPEDSIVVKANCKMGNDR